jgi:hypothetical protein
MSSLWALAAAGLLVCAAGPASAAAVRGRPYDINQHPVTNREFGLLFKSSFTIKDDGTVWAPRSSSPVLESEMPYVLEKLVSSQRLKALLTLNLILSRSKGEKDLTPEERESIRRTVRENWHFLNYDTRKDFKGYFNLDELDAMNADAPLPRPRLAQNILDEADEETPPPEARPKEEPEGPVSSAGEPLQYAAAASKPDPNAPEMPVVDLTRAKQETAPAEPAPPVPVPAVAAAKPAPAAVPTPQIAPPLMTPLALRQPAAAVEPVRPSTAAQQAPAETGAVAGLPKGMTRETYERLFPSQPPQPAKAPAPPPATPAPQTKAHPKVESAATALVAPVTPEQFEKFLADAPYSRQVRTVLKLVSDHAPSFARDRTLSLVMTVIPNIVIDAGRTGHGLRFGLEEAEGRPAAVVLSPGPMVFEKKGLFFKGAEVLLTQTPAAYRDLGLPPPGLEAMIRESSPSKAEDSDWGERHSFSDGSSRGTFSPESQAGTLLAALLGLDLARRGQDADPYTAALYLRTSQMMLYAKVDREKGSDAFLDRETRASYRQWVQSPSEFRDHLLHTLTAGLDASATPSSAGPALAAAAAKAGVASCQTKGPAAPAFDPRSLRVKALKAAGLIDGRRMDEALAFVERSAPPRLEAGPDACRKLEKTLSDLQRSPRLIEEMLQAEARFRSGGAL